MKLQCKLCGSNELTYKNGQLVCDQCGRRFSLEEAKSILNISTTQEQNNLFAHDNSFRTNNCAQEPLYNERNQHTALYIALTIMATIAILGIFYACYFL